MRFIFTNHLLFILLCLSPIVRVSAQSCGTAGSIERGSSSLLDLDSDGYFSIYNGSGYTISNNEFTEFESLAGTGGANLGWTRLTGSDPNNDLQSGGGCGNTDITNDLDGGSDYAYYSIVDPNSTADDGDEYLVFALRISDKVNGNFGFSFLLDSDNNCGSGDPNAVCGNPCFEYEIQLNTSNSGGTVDLFNVDGCYGTSNCNTVNSPSATICTACNSGGIQVCAGSSACGGANPVFWVFYIHFSQIPGVNSTTVFSLTPASNTSGNPIVFKSANVSDFGGVDDINDLAGACDCVVQCSGSSCAKCEDDCLLSCAAEANIVTYNPVFPVEFLSFSTRERQEGIDLRWNVLEDPANAYYEVERGETHDHFERVHVLQPFSVFDQSVEYSFLDLPPQRGQYFYRIRQVDQNGTTHYSSIIEATFSGRSIVVFKDFGKSQLYVRQLPPVNKSVKLFSISGQLILEHRLTSDIHQLELSLASLSKGVYILRIEQAGALIHQQKLIH